MSVLPEQSGMQQPPPESSEGTGRLSDFILELFHNSLFRWSLIIVALLSYGLYVTTFPISVDDLSGERYVIGELLAQKRFTWPLLARVLHLIKGYPFFDAALAILTFLFGGTLVCAVFRKATHRKLSIAACTAFCCLLISYPLLSDAFYYMFLPHFLAIGTVLVTLALYWCFQCNGQFVLKNQLIASVLLMFAASLYESLIAVYLFLVFALLLMQIRSGTGKVNNVSSLFKTGLQYALPLLVGILLEAVVSTSILTLFHITPSTYAANSIMWLVHGKLQCLKDVICGFLYNYVIKSIVYLPIAILVISMIIIFIFSIADTVKYKKIHIALLYVGLFFSLMAISIFQGASSPYRIQFVCAFFVAFAGLLVIQLAVEQPMGLKRYLLVGMVSFAIFYQANDINHWFSVEYQRSENERHAIYQIGYTLERDFDTTKPILFVGNYYTNIGSEFWRSIAVTDEPTVTLINRLRNVIHLKSLSLIPVQDTLGRSYIAWSLWAWGDSSDLIKYFDILGFDFTAISGTTLRDETYMEALAMPAWPASGCIVDKGDYLILKLGGM